MPPKHKEQILASLFDVALKAPPVLGGASLQGVLFMTGEMGGGVFNCFFEVALIIRFSCENCWFFAQKTNNSLLSFYLLMLFRKKN